MGPISIFSIPDVTFNCELNFGLVMVTKDGEGKEGKGGEGGKGEGSRGRREREGEEKCHISFKCCTSSIVR